jgi:hypothetical protein
LGKYLRALRLEHRPISSVRGFLEIGKKAFKENGRVINQKNHNELRFYFNRTAVHIIDFELKMVIYKKFSIFFIIYGFYR